MDDKKYKTKFKWFTVPQWMEEEKYLREMHKKGWEFLSVKLPGFYFFEKKEPEDVIYKLDYNQEGLKDKDEYLQMFSDCGWEYVCEMTGYTYFRKKVNKGENIEDDDIFGDDDSRLDMIKRVYKGKLVPLIAIFLCCIIPQMFLHIDRAKVGMLDSVMFGLFFVLFIVYLILFIDFGINYIKLKKKLRK